MEKDLYLRIGRPHNTCMLCGAPIAVAGKHASVLLPPDEAQSAASGQEEAENAAPPPGGNEPAPDGPLRQDYCPSCWEKARQKNYFSFWIARREPPKPKKIKNRKERNAALLAYFDYLLLKKDPAYAQHLYFMAHLLMKFSALKWVRSEPPATPDGGERIVFRNTQTDDLVAIEAVPLEDEAIARIKREIDDFICRNVENAPE